MKRVAIIGDNSVEYVRLLIDMWNKRYCVALIDYHTPLIAAMEIMLECGIYECYIDSAIINGELPLNSPITFYPYVCETREAQNLPFDVYNNYYDNYSYDDAVILFSSGTTGKAKGIVLSHYAINTNADAIIDYMALTSTDCIYVVKPLFHASSFTGELLVALKTKSKCIIGSTVVPPRYVFRNIHEFNVTIICINPILATRFLNEYKTGKYEFPFLRSIYISGSVLQDCIYDDLKRTFAKADIYNMYGLTEAGPRVSAQTKSSRNINSVGMPVKNVTIQIVDETGRTCPANRVGTVYVKTPSCFSQYCVGDMDTRLTSDGWLNTGDVGYWDEYHELHITGRIDDMIIINSHNVYPATIENYLIGEKIVDDCYIDGVLIKSNTVMVCFYSGSLKGRESFIQSLSDRFLGYEIPQIYINVTEIERNSNGKINKQYYKEQLKKIQGDHDEA
jgi:long-chain acyl-CoA synthetase